VQPPPPSVAGARPAMAFVTVVVPGASTVASAPTTAAPHPTTKTNKAAPAFSAPPDLNNFINL
jgi:hypothetical protein